MNGRDWVNGEIEAEIECWGVEREGVENKIGWVDFKRRKRDGLVRNW